MAKKQLVLAFFENEAAADEAIEQVTAAAESMPEEAAAD